MAKIGTVGYLNARPLSDRIDIDRHTLVLAHPAEVARMLRDREVDVALVPAAAVLAEPPGDNAYRIVPGWCVGSAGPVTSVLLVAETPPEAWTKVVLDGVSRTSVVLAQLLLRTAGSPLAARVRPDLEVVAAGPNEALGQAKRNTAALVIGDAARTVPERLPVRIDLASEWAAWTGLPFVFAVWAGRPDLDPSVVRHLAVAGAAGVAAIRTSYAGDDLRYLTESLRYPLDDLALIGLRRFAALAHAAGLVNTAEFELYGPEPRRARPDVDGLLARALDGGALPIGEVHALLSDAPVSDLAAAADLRRRQGFPGDDLAYRIDAVLPEGASPSTIADAVALGASRVRLEGRLTPARVREVAARWPGLALVGGGPEDGDPAALAAAGLTDTVEHVGSLVDRVRAAAGASSAAEWRAWAERAHRAGIRVEATVAVGRGTVDDLAGHLLRLAEIPGLASVRVWAPAAPGPFGSAGNTASDVVRALAVARLVLPASVRVVGSSETEGIGLVQVCLRFGCDHGGSVVLDGEAAGWSSRIAAFEHQVTEAGLRPVVDRVSASPAS